MAICSYLRRVHHPILRISPLPFVHHSLYLWCLSSYIFESFSESYDLNFLCGIGLQFREFSFEFPNPSSFYYRFSPPFEHCIKQSASHLTLWRGSMIFELLPYDTWLDLRWLIWRHLIGLDLLRVGQQCSRDKEEGNFWKLQTVWFQNSPGSGLLYLHPCINEEILRNVLEQFPSWKSKRFQIFYILVLIVEVCKSETTEPWQAF